MRILSGISMSVKLFLVLLTGLVAVASSPMPVYAQLQDTACEGFQEALGTSGGCGEEGGDQINSTLETVVNIMSVVVAIIAVIMIIIAGFKYVTSNGDSNSVSGAKDTIIYAIVGLAIVAVAQFIVRFVLGQITS
jgi:heme/copper-type cytochrome/quinol oxidase subunit 2